MCGAEAKEIAALLKCHPHVLLSANYWMASRRGEGRVEQNKRHKCNLTPEKRPVTLTKSIEIWTQTLLETLGSLLSSTPAQSGCEPCHYVWLGAVCELPLHLGLREIAGFQGGECFYSRDHRFSTLR